MNETGKVSLICHANARARPNGYAQGHGETRQGEEPANDTIQVGQLSSSFPYARAGSICEALHGRSRKCVTNPVLQVYKTSSQLARKVAELTLRSRSRKCLGLGSDMIKQHCFTGVHVIAQRRIVHTRTS